MSETNLETLHGYSAPITETLESVLTGLRQEFPTDLSALGEWALQELTDYVQRPSKRLRGSLAAYTYDAMCGNDSISKQGLQLGAALELMQNYLLIVDDVMDQSPLRRGQPTVQVLYKSAHPDASEHEADMAAVNVGLLAQHVASIVLSRIDESSDRVKTVAETVHRNIAITGLGQIDDLYQQIGRKVERTDIERKHILKSAYYTFINPIQAGLALAGVEDSHNDAVRYGVPAGTAFQVHDDYLGIFGDGAETGKMNLDDIREGKYTFMVQYALENAETSDIARLTQILGNPKASVADLVIIRDIFRKTGAVKANEEVERRSMEAANSAVTNSTLWPEDYKRSLIALVKYSVERTS